MSNVTTVDKTNQTMSNLEYIKKAMFPVGTGIKDMEYCLEVSKLLNLNPISKEIFFIKRKAKQQDGTFVEKTDPLVSRDGLLTIANRTNLFAGIKTSYEVKNVPVKKEDSWTSTKDLTAKCEVRKKGFDTPFVAEVVFSEYAQYTNDGNLTVFWKSKPITMLQKVAEAQALKKAFQIRGVNTFEEMGVTESDAYLDTSIEVPKNDISEKAIVVKQKTPKKEVKVNVKTDETPKAVVNTTKKETKVKTNTKALPKGITLEQTTITSDKFGQQEYMVCNGKNTFDDKDKLKELGFFWLQTNKKWGMLLDKAINKGLITNIDNNDNTHQTVVEDVEDDDIPF